MNQTPMNSLDRVLTTLSQKEPDRIPVFLLLTMHGAKELGLTIKEYFSNSENVIKGQLRMRAKYQNDCLFGFLYAAQEAEAFGMETIFIEDGPPNAGEPIIKKAEDILILSPPNINDCEILQRVLTIQRQLKSEVGNEVPIVGVVVAPFSLPIMQMGFEKYLDLIYERPDLFARLMQINEEFCIEWANAQLAAGATFITLFDPVSSTSIVSRDQYLRYGHPSASRVIAKIKGSTATHFASGRCLPIIEDVVLTGTTGIGVSADEDLAELKSAVRGRLGLVGNLNGIEMRNWNSQQVEEKVKKAIANAGIGGGFILSDNHGEIPFQVSDDTLLTIGDAARKWGEYPLAWAKDIK